MMSVSVSLIMSVMMRVCASLYHVGNLRVSGSVIVSVTLICLRSFQGTEQRADVQSKGKRALTSSQPKPVSSLRCFPAAGGFLLYLVCLPSPVCGGVFIEHDLCMCEFERCVCFDVSDCQGTDVCKRVGKETGESVCLSEMNLRCGVSQAHLTYASSVQAGARNGIEECKQQFAWDRWNCPESALHLTTPGRLRAGTMSFCSRTNITRLKSLI